VVYVDAVAVPLVADVARMCLGRTDESDASALECRGVLGWDENVGVGCGRQTRYKNSYL